MDIKLTVDRLIPGAKFNRACFNFQEEVARERGLWYCDCKMPTITELEECWSLIEDGIQQQKINDDAREFLRENDWKIIRHVRQLKLVESEKLGQTSLTDAEYLALCEECQRQADLVQD